MYLKKIIYGLKDGFLFYLNYHVLLIDVNLMLEQGNVSENLFHNRPRNELETSQ